MEVPPGDDRAYRMHEGRLSAAEDYGARGQARGIRARQDSDQFQNVALSEEDENMYQFRPKKEKKAGFFASIFGCMSSKKDGEEGLEKKQNKPPKPIAKR